MADQEQTVGLDLLNDFLGSVSAEDKEKIQKTTDDASAEGRSKPLKVSGKYRMKVDTLGFFGKDDKVPVLFPSLQKAKESGTLQLVVRLSTTESTDQVKAGSYISVYVPLIAAPKHEGESEEKHQKRVQGTQSMCKRYLATLLGTTEIRVVDPNWIATNLLPSFNIDANKITVVRDHKMKNELFVTVEDDVWDNKPTWKVVDISAAQAGDKSFSNKPVFSQDGGPSAPAESSNVDLANMTADPEDVAAEGLGFQPSIPD